MPATLKPFPKSLPKVRDLVELELEIREVRAATDEAPAEEQIWVTLSTESPVKRWFGQEVLGHQPSEVDLKDAKQGIPLYLEHGMSEFMPDPDLMIGSVRDLTIENSKLRGWLDFSSSARGQQARADVKAGHWRWGSVGRIRDKAKETKAPVNGDDREVRVVRWKPVEWSLVGVPADFKSKIDRSAGGDEFPVEFEGLGPEGKESRPMKKVRNEQNVVIEVSDDDPRPAVSDSPGGGDPVVVRAANSEHAVAVLELCESHGIEMPMALEMVKRGLTREQAGMEILQRKSGRPHAAPPSEAVVALTPKEAKRYSYTNAIQAAVARREGRSVKTFETEVSDDIQQRIPRGAELHGGILVPWRLEGKFEQPRELRAQISYQAGKGMETVFDQPGELIELLRPQSVAARLGAQILPGLTAPVPFPREGGDVTISWMGENPATGVAETDMDWETVNLFPKTLMGSTRISRQLINSSSVDIEQRNRNSLVIGTGLAIDRGAFHGVGADKQPTGIYVAPDVLSHAVGGVPDWTDITTMIGLVADKNANFGTMGFVTTALMAAKLMSVLVASAAGSEMIWKGPIEAGQIGGYRAIGSTQISKTLGAGANEHGLIFANWNDLLIGMFGALEIVADPYTLADKGLIKVTSFQMADVLLRHGESFCKGTGATTS